MPARRHHRLLRASALVAAAALSALPSRAGAEVRIADSLSSGALVVEAREATVQEVLDALSRVRPLEIHSSAALSRVITGTYSGSLSRVLARVLDGYDNVIQSSPAGVKLSVFGVGTASRAAVARMTPAVSVTPVNRPVSDNLDLDEENAQRAAGIGVSPSPAVAPVAGPRLLAAVPSHPAVSSNVDLDEELSTR
jgi:hypothetical protein